MPEMKEPHFFVRKSIGPRIQSHVGNIEDYAALFADTGQARWRGEASVFYLYYHTEAIPNIVATVGRQVPIIIVLRNPVERAFSAYLHAAKFNAKENATFKEALTLEPVRMNDPSCSPMLFYQSVGFYDAMVAAFKAAFPRIGIYLFDDLVAEPEKFARELFALLEVPVPSDIDFRERINEGGREWVRPEIGGVLKGLGTNAVRRVAKNAAPETYQRLRNALTRRLMRPADQLEEETRARLARVFRDDVYRLSDNLGRDVTHWVNTG